MLVIPKTPVPIARTDVATDRMYAVTKLPGSSSPIRGGHSWPPSSPQDSGREEVPVLRAVRRSIRPIVLTILRAMPSPEKCGCASRKAWMIRQIEAL
jgi:hypothetical protein